MVCAPPPRLRLKRRNPYHKSFIAAYYGIEYRISNCFFAPPIFCDETGRRALELRVAHGVASGS